MACDGWNALEWAQGLLRAGDLQASHLAVLETHDLLYVLDLCIARNLGHACVPHIQQLSPAEPPHVRPRSFVGHAV